MPRTAHRAGDDGVGHLRAQVLAHVGRHVLGQRRAGVVHHQHHGADLQRGVQGLLDQLDVAQELAEALEGVVLALDGDQDLPHGGEGVQGEQAEGRWAVDEDVVVVVFHRGQGRAQPQLPRHGRHQLDLGAGQVQAGGGHEEVAHLAGLDAVLDGHVVQQHVVHRGVELPDVQAEAGAGVALGIEVDDEDPQAPFGQAGAQVDRGGRLAHAALLVGHGDDPRIPGLGQGDRQVGLVLLGSHPFIVVLRTGAITTTGPRHRRPSFLFGHPNARTLDLRRMRSDEPTERWATPDEPVWSFDHPHRERLIIAPSPAPAPSPGDKPSTCPVIDDANDIPRPLRTSGPGAGAFHGKPMPLTDRKSFTGNASEQRRSGPASGPPGIRDRGTPQPARARRRRSPRSPAGPPGESPTCAKPSSGQRSTPSGGSLTSSRPPTRRRGAAHSATTAGGPNAREVTTSAVVRYDGSRPTSSARAWTTSTRSASPRRRQAETR